MSVTTDVYYVPEEKIVAAVVEGRLTPEAAQQAVSEIARVSTQNGTHCLLMDLRGAKLQASMTDIYYLPALLADAGLTRLHKQALVVAQDEEKYDFLATVFANRGYWIRVFSDSESATSWLKDSSLALLAE